MKTERHVGKHSALGAPYGKTGPSSSRPWPCPGEQAVTEDIYYPAALRCAQIEAEEAKRDAEAWKKTAFAMSNRAFKYQVLALLGWAAVIVMGVLV